MKSGKRSTAAPRNHQDRGMSQRLQDQARLQRKIQNIHANPRLLNELAFYPAHDKRKETPQYKAVHRKLTQTLDLPCLICGVSQSTLKDKSKNLYGAKQMETHHHIIEWALANAVDVDRFNAILLPHLKHRHAGKPEYRKPAFTQQDILDWVDHSEDNLWVLCDVHHRAKYLGIHEISYPIWSPMELLRSDFTEYVRQQLASIRQKNTKAGRSSQKLPLDGG